MAVPTLTPASQTSQVVLTSTGSVEKTSNGAGNKLNYPLGIYVDVGSHLYDDNFVSGASDQVAYVYRKLGGEVLDIELTVADVYSSYEEAVLEYSYIMNLHQSKNVLSDLLGQSTGTFDNRGNIIGGDVSGTYDSGPNQGGRKSEVNLRYPRFKFGYTKKVALGLTEEAGFGGNLRHYSASFKVENNVQDYDLQAVISGNVVNDEEPATGTSPTYASVINDGDRRKKITIRRVYYKTPQSTWRFYGYYGGMNVVGNMNYYGQFADDTTFEIIPAWHNKLQAMAFDDHLYTRLSHYSYEIRNNRLRIFPQPEATMVQYMWFDFTVDDGSNAWDEVDDIDSGVRGINNLNTLPFDNLPFKNINSIGKQWIRRYSLALCKETLGYVRSKY